MVDPLYYGRNIDILLYLYSLAAAQTDGPDTRNRIPGMPAYDYVCEDCGASFEVRASMSAYSQGLKPTCPECGSQNAVRKFAAVNVLTRSLGGSSSSGRCGRSGFT